MDSETSQSQPTQQPSEPPQESSGMIGLMAWVEVNKKRLITIAVVGTLVIFGTMLLIQHQAQKEKNASAALSDVKVPYNASLPPAPGTAESLLKVANDQKGSKAAARALLISAGVLYSESKYAEAQQRFGQVIQEYPDSAWTAQANLGVAASIAAQGKADEATAKYEEITKRFASSPVIDEARLGLARLYEAKKPEDAFKLYDELMKSNPQSVLAMESNMRSEIMLKQHPELLSLKESLNPRPAPTPSQQQVQITPMTNRVMTTVTNAVKSVVSNAAAATKPVQIKLSPTPTPGAANTAPAK